MSASPTTGACRASVRSSVPPCSSSLASEPLIIVVSGPGGVGKGAIVDARVARDPALRLSRSWTSRSQRLGDPGAPDIVLEIELDGAQQVKRKFPDALLIFVLPPTRDEQERRLRG